MNILVIGNGFDLAHGLPTKYEHFLKFVNMYKENIDILISGQSIKDDLRKLNDENKEYLIFLRNLKEKKKIFSELDGLISSNFWIGYFLSVFEDRKKSGKEGWIDFEGEIFGIIKQLAKDMNNASIDEEMARLSCEYLNKIYYSYTFKQQRIDEYEHKMKKTITWREIRNRLLNDLNKLI